MADPWIEKFRKVAMPRISKEFKPKKVIVFGSRARGTAKNESDIDIIMVSSYFEKVPFLKRMPLVMRKAPFPKHVDYICYTPREYERMKKESSVIMDALDNAVELTAA